MGRTARITALLVTVALLATPLGATVCAGHCAQPQPMAPSPVSHCGSATTESTASAQGAAAQLAAVNPCGVKSVPTVLKAGDDPTRLQLVLPAQPVKIAAMETAVRISITPRDTSPPSVSAPHLTPLRI